MRWAERHPGNSAATDTSHLAAENIMTAGDDHVTYGHARSDAVTDFHAASGPHLFDRLEPFLAWQRQRDEFDDLPRFDCGGEAASRIGTIDLAMRDALGLSRHPDVHAAARAAIEKFGVAGVAFDMSRGDTRLSRLLERELGSFLEIEHVVLVPDGRTAAAQAIRALLRSDDHVIIDAFADAGLQAAADVATKHVHRCPHLSLDWTHKLLARIRARDTRNAVLVVAESCFATTANAPDLRALQESCQEFGAFLLVDATQDLGCLGPEGGGQLASQAMTGRVDIVTGRFAPVFATDGGFVATRSAAVRAYLRAVANPDGETATMSPLQSAIALTCLDIIRSQEGAERRARLLQNIHALRGSLAGHGLKPLGGIAATIPVLIGREVIARLTVRAASRRGALVRLAEHPRVAKSRARLMLHVTADHTPLQLRDGGTALRAAFDDAEEEFARARFSIERGWFDKRVALAPQPMSSSAE
jgi:7-keto-8-aminopelargonate synthetase-like enzyme